MCGMQLTQCLEINNLQCLYIKETLKINDLTFSLVVWIKKSNMNKKSQRRQIIKGEMLVK